ncbi:hypothetical protein VP01_5415g4 [Puccinia sorghi]|uniref:Uncharacterized protein n=1 Tax=Puccinia sorghi TaxID=27349 RepID=A0A0L6UJR4_9BASI|nr:hypothetical protein VP01_5415g4 [Puccinia sorghi]
MDQLAGPAAKDQKILLICWKQFRKGDLEKLEVEKADKGRVEERWELDEFVSSFDCILKYLNQNELIIGTGAFSRGYPPASGAGPMPILQP